MNTRNFLLVLLAFSSVLLSGQETGKTIFFDNAPLETINRLPLHNESGRVVGDFLYKRLPNGTTQIGIDYSAVGSSGVLLELKRQGKTIYIDNLNENGPHSDCEIISSEDETMYSKQFHQNSMDEDEDWIIFVLAVAYCCVEVEVAHSEEEGYSSSITFDCDCFSISLSNAPVTTGDGQNYNNIDEIVLTAL